MKNPTRRCLPATGARRRAARSVSHRKRYSAAEFMKSLMPNHIVVSSSVVFMEGDGWSKWICNRSNTCVLRHTVWDSYKTSPGQGARCDQIAFRLCDISLSTRSLEHSGELAIFSLLENFDLQFSGTFTVENKTSDLSLVFKQKQNRQKKTCEFSAASCSNFRKLFNPDEVEWG